MTQIDYYFSLISPFTYFASDRLEQMAGRHGASITYKPIDAMKVFAETGGLPVPKRHPSRQAYRLQELRRGAQKAGLPLNFHPAHWPTDAVPASCAVIAVAERGGDAGGLAHAFLRACWGEEKDIADPGVIAATLSAQGEDAGALKAAMSAAQATFERNTEAAIGAGVFGVPFYIVGEERFWGHDRLDDLDAHLGALAA